MKRLLATLALVALFSPLSARAATIDFVGTGLGIDGFKATFTSGTYTRTYGFFAGQLMLSGLEGYSSPFAAFCLDFNSYLQDPQYNMQVRPIADYPNLNGGDVPPYAQAGVGERIGWLLNQSVATNVQAGALQLAIWEVILERPGSGYALNTGSFRVADLSQAVVDQATWYLANLGTSPNALWLDVKDSNGWGQDYGVRAVPEPATMALFGTGLLGLGFVARRRARPRK
jgi:hypothetical protein